MSMSLLERFDAMETEAGEPERRIGTVVMQRDAKVVTYKWIELKQSFTSRVDLV